MVGGTPSRWLTIALFSSANPSKDLLSTAPTVSIRVKSPRKFTKESKHRPWWSKPQTTLCHNGGRENTPWKKRGQEYEAVKEEFAQRLLNELYKQLPQVKGKINCYELSTPLTTQHFVNYEKGEIYGLDHSPSRFRQSFLKPRTPIKNFYLTGQDIVTAGVGGALFSGVLTTMAMTGKNVLKKI